MLNPVYTLYSFGNTEEFIYASPRPFMEILTCKFFLMGKVFGPTKLPQVE
jgi:hypothetical protein